MYINSDSESSRKMPKYLITLTEPERRQTSGGIAKQKFFERGV